jgi:L-iditol 2-dehydrogenase
MGSAHVSRASSGVTPELSSQTISKVSGAGSFEERSFRRDAENNTPEASAPQSFAATIKKITRNQLLDAAIIAVPSDEAVLHTQHLVRGGGQRLLFAHTRRGDNFPLDLSSVCVDEKDILGSYSSDITVQHEVARLIFSRKMDVRKLITHEFPLEKAAQAIQLAAKPTAESLKIVVTAPPG